MSATSAQRLPVDLGRRARDRRLGLEPEAELLVVAVLAFIAVSIWWLTQDSRVQDWDNGLHTLAAFSIHDQIAAGNLTGWFTGFNSYPPLVHVVGAVGVFIAGKSPMSVIITSNLVFVPLLAASCYGVGRLIAGPRAGLLAGLFGLGTPIFVSQMHVFMVDPPQAAMVAASVWAILASQRFERLGLSALAGVAVGLAMMTKETSLIFLTGPVLVTIVRGGFRQWRGLALFVVIAAAISLPWYVYHADQLSSLVSLHGGALGGQYTNGTPPVLSRSSLLWYFWAAANIELLVPLLLFLAVGVVFAVRDCMRRFTPENFTPEILAGLVVSWLGMTLIRHKDVRFMLPALVFVAVLATIWIPAARPPVRQLATGLLGVVLLANFLGISTGTGPTLRASLPGASKGTFWKRQLTFYSPAGYIRGGPEHDGNILALMRGLRRSGVHEVAFDPGSTDVSDFTIYGLTVRAIQAGLPVAAGSLSALGSHDAFMLRHFRQPGDPPPCQRLRDGSGVYVELGNPVTPFQTYTLICPARNPEVYRRTAPLSLAAQIQLNPDITGQPRALLLHVFTALRRRGILALVIDHASADALFFQPQGVAALAASVQLPVAWTLPPSQLSPREAFVFRRKPRPGGPAACGRFPDGTGLYVVAGNPYVARPDYLCPIAGNGSSAAPNG